MHKLFTLLILLTFFCVGIAQEPSIQLRINIDSEESKSGFKVQLIGGGQSEEISDKSGKVIFSDVLFDRTYQLVVSKKGMATKSFLIDAKSGYYPDETSSTSVTLDVEMIKKKDFVTYEIIEGEPVGKMAIQNSGELEWNLSFNQARKIEIDKFLNKVDQIASENKSLYNALVKETEKWIEEKDADKAEELLAQVDAVAMTSKNKKLAAKIEQLRGQNKKERDLIDKIFVVADSLYGTMEYTSALGYYERIIRLEPNNTKAYNRIQEINELLVEESDTIKRNVKTPTTELIANAKSAQERRIYSTMGYQPRSYKPVERVRVDRFEHVKDGLDFNIHLDCCKLDEEQRKLKNCKCEEEEEK